MVNKEEMKSMERSILDAYRDFAILFHQNPFAVKPEEFHNKVTARVEELLLIAQNIEEKGKKRAF